MKWLNEAKSIICGNCDKSIPLTNTKKGMNYCPYCNNEVYYNDNEVEKVDMEEVLYDIFNMPIEMFNRKYIGGK